MLATKQMMFQLITEGVLLDDARRFAKAQKQLWTIRCHLHYLAGREEDRLPRSSARNCKTTWYMDRSGNTAVERFMKHYYLTAKDVGISQEHFAPQSKKSINGNLPKTVCPGDARRALEILS